jgi:hypothetical protein
MWWQRKIHAINGKGSELFFEGIEPSFNNKQLEIGKSLCTLLNMVFEAFLVDGISTHQDVKSCIIKLMNLSKSSY